MAEKFIINAGALAITSEGETTAAWTATESTGAPTVTEQGALTDIDAIAIMQTAPTAAEKAQVATLLGGAAVAADFSAITDARVGLAAAAFASAVVTNAAGVEFRDGLTAVERSYIIATLASGVTGQVGAARTQAQRETQKIAALLLLDDPQMLTVRKGWRRV